MYLNITFDPDFDALMLTLKDRYGQEMFDVEGIGKQLDLSEFARSFFKSKHTADVSVDSNANVAGRDVITYNFELPKPFMRLNSYYLLWRELKEHVGLVEANRLIEAQLRGDFYINDFGDIGRPYCFNYSTFDIALEGLPMGGRIKPVAPKHLNSFMRQVEQFIVYAANSTLGATGLADILIVMAYYADRVVDTQSDDGIKFASKADAWKYVSKRLDKLVYTLNWEFRGNQSPFTNISLYDKHFLKNLLPSYVFPDGRAPRPGTVRWLQKEFVKVMNKELRRAPLTFPVATACFSLTKDGASIRPDKDFMYLVSKGNLEFGFMNIYHGDSSTLSSCCRLRSDTKNEYFNSFGAGSTKIGSLGVATANLPRLAWKAKGDREKFIWSVVMMVKDVAIINNAKRTIIQDRITRGALPLYTLGHMDIRKQYSTFGITGLAEALEILGLNIRGTQGQEFVLRVLDAINVANDVWAERFLAPHNCEQTPAENSSIKLATKDFLMGVNEVHYPNDGRVRERKPVYPLYSNQFIPLTTEATMLERLFIQGKFDKHFSGGAICHINVGSPLTDRKQMEDLIRTAAGLGVVYWAVNYHLQLCANSHMTVGKGETCPTCGADIVSHFTRVVGFLTSVEHWHKVRREHDYPHRQFYGEANTNA